MDWWTLSFRRTLLLQVRNCLIYEFFRRLHKNYPAAVPSGLDCGLQQLIRFARATRCIQVMDTQLQISPLTRNRKNQSRRKRDAFVHGEPHSNCFFAGFGCATLIRLEIKDQITNCRLPPFRSCLSCIAYLFMLRHTVAFRFK